MVFCFPAGLILLHPVQICASSPPRAPHDVPATPKTLPFSLLTHSLKAGPKAVSYISGLPRGATLEEFGATDEQTGWMFCRSKFRFRGEKKKIKYQLGKQSLQGAGNRSPEELARSVCHREYNSIPLSLSSKGKKRKKFPTHGCTRAGQKGSGAPGRAASHKSGAEHSGASVPPSPPLPVTSSVPAEFFFFFTFQCLIAV